MSQTFYTSQAAEITLGAKLGSGGEGEVYELRGEPELTTEGGGAICPAPEGPT